MRSMSRNSSAAFSLRFFFCASAMSNLRIEPCSAGLPLELDLQSLGCDLQAGPFGDARQHDLDLLGVDDGRRALAFLNRDASAGDRVDAVEVVEALEVVDVSGGFRSGYADFTHGESLDF